MKVGLLHYTGPPTVGGVEQTLAWHAHHLAAFGHDPKLIVGAGVPFEEGIPMRVLPRLNSRHADVMTVKAELDRGIVSERFHVLADRIRQDLAEGARDLDVLVVHNALSLHKNLALTAALWDLHRAGTWSRLIAWHHDLAWERAEYAPELHSGEPWDLLRRPWPGVVQVAVSETVRRQLADLNDVRGDSILVIPPGVEPAAFGRWSQTTRDLHAALGLGQADLVLLLPSRLTRRKNIELAIAIVAALRRRSGLDIRLLVTGPPGPHNPANEAYLGELLEQCRRLRVPDAIHFLHRVDPQAPSTLDATTVAELFTVADALLFTSRDEGFGIPILEAGLARLPVFCTDIPAFRESGGDEVTYFGLGSSEEEVAELILDSLERDPRYRLRQRVLREYSWSRLVHDRLVPLLEPSGHD